MQEIARIGEPQNNAVEASDSAQRIEFGNVFVVIPMLNEEASIGLVLNDLPPVAEVVVVDNGSTDAGPQKAADAGATVIRETQRGYGKACLTGIAHVRARKEADSRSGNDTIVVFLDGDYSDHPNEITDLIQPIQQGDKDFVLGSRSIGQREQGAMHFQAVFGNWLACTLMKLFWGANFTDLGPFRAIRFSSLEQLRMRDEDYGWTIEMQIKAVRHKLRIAEIPVSYRCRVGVSKISGTVSGTIKAGYKILYTIFRYRFFSDSKAH